MQPSRILIVDDQLRSRQSMRALLATWFQPETVIEAANGAEALTSALALRPEVVITDARMSGMDGVELTRRLKSQFPSVSVIVLSLYSEYRVPALAAGADAFISKGEPPEVLAQALALLDKPDHSK